MSGELRQSSSLELLFWVLRLRRRFRVVGASMHPLLQPGEEVLIDPRAYRQHQPVVGDVVVAEHPQRPAFRLVKRVAAVWPDGRCQLEGDNRRASTDSRDFGLVPPHKILGRVTSRLP